MTILLLLDSICYFASDRAADDVLRAVSMTFRRLRARSANIAKPSLFPYLASFVLACSGIQTTFGKDGPDVRWKTGNKLTLQRAFKDSHISVGVSSRTAGAIDSITWDGVEFINSYDHGRELQSSISLNGLVDCFNPTEAGSQGDGPGNASTSELLSLKSGDDWMETKTRMAYWLPAGAPIHTRACPSGTLPYQTDLSNYVLTKRISVGAAGIANVIEYDATFNVPEAFRAATFEVVTAYMPAAFKKFWTFNLGNGVVAPLSEGPGEQFLPIIFSTEDRSHALGVLCDKQSSTLFAGPTYGRFQFAHLVGKDNASVKWNCVFRRKEGPADEYRFRAFVIVGSVDEIAKAIGALRTSTH